MNPAVVRRYLGTGILLAGLGSATLIAVIFLLTPSARAQDAGALVNILVQKGILSDQEGAEVRAEMQKEVSQSSAGKITLSNSVTELDIYGDLRFRYQYNSATPVLAGPGSTAVEQDRWRYRLRLNADWSLGPDWFAGMQLRTNQASDAGMQTYGTTFNNDSIYISRAFLGFQNDWLRVVAGKQANPFYTTDLLWDPDISPSGLTESIALQHLPFFGGGAAGPDGPGKETASNHAGPWEFSLVAAQFTLGDDSKFANTGDLATDPWMFDEQLSVKYKFNKNTSITLAPGFMAENTAHITGALNTLPFSDEGAVISGTTAVTTTTQQQQIVATTFSAAGVATKTITPTTVTTTTQSQITPNNTTSGTATVSGPRTIAVTSTASRTGAIVTLVGPAATGIATNPALAGQSFTTTTTGQKQTVKTTNNVILPEVHAETADLHIITAPGDVSFTLGGLKTKLYWDFAYNVTGEDRYNYVYQMKAFGSQPYRVRDSFAWLVGLSLGEIKKIGDWEAFVDYRETGIASIDPNINDNESGGGALNMRGVKFGLAYAVTDFIVVEGTGYLFRDLEPNLFGGRATSVGGIAPFRAYDEATLEVNVKF